MPGVQGSRCRLVPPAIYLILVLLFAPLTALHAQAPVEFEELVVEVRINEQDVQDMLVVLRDAAGGFWIDTAELERLRLSPPAVPVREYQGQHYVPFAAWPGTEVRFDAPLAMLFVQLPAGAFMTVRISAKVPRVDGPGESANGLFANYQLYGQHVSGIDSGGSFTEIGMFNRLGVFTTTTATRHGGGDAAVTRLDTALTRDFPSRLQTLTIGDSISDPGAFGSALRFAGMRLQKNFAMRPELVTAPLLVATGTAVVPSAVDVFVNNQRVLTQQVQPGPFVIDNLPTVTGAGDVRVVVRDATGREQVLVQPFYSSPQLLARGLDQYSFSAGKVRKDYTLRSFDYGKWNGSGTWRHGFSDFATVEGHAEFLQGDAWGAGAQLAARLGGMGLASFTAAAGGGDGHRGWLAGLGFERQGGRASFAVNASYASSGFRRAGEFDADDSRQQLRGTLQVGYNFGLAGSSMLAVAQQRSQDGTRLRNLSFMHSLRAGRQGFMNLSVNRALTDRKSTSAFLTYTQAFGSSRTFSAAAEGGSGFGASREEVRASFAQATPTGEGAGWRVSATRSGNYDAWWQQRFAAADVELQTARNFHQSGQSLQVRGGLSWLANQFHAARTVDGSFAVVDVGGLPDVPVYLENRLITRTDASGRAVLPNLLSYEANRISIEPEDLPLDAAIGSRQMVVRPAYRSGVLARFPVERINPAVFRLRLPDNTPVPAGAEVQVNGGTFNVAMDGFTYVTTLDHGTGGAARWPGGRCLFRVEPPPAGDPLPDMGDITCRPTAAETP
jgi:outer membrane usher protein